MRKKWEKKWDGGLIFENYFGNKAETGSEWLKEVFSIIWIIILCKTCEIVFWYFLVKKQSEPKETYIAGLIFTSLNKMFMKDGPQDEDM